MEATTFIDYRSWGKSKFGDLATGMRCVVSLTLVIFSMFLTDFNLLRHQYRFQAYRDSVLLILRSPLGSRRPKASTHLCSISLRVAIPACCWLAVLARAMAGLAARESIVMSGEWMD